MTATTTASSSGSWPAVSPVACTRAGSADPRSNQGPRHRQSRPREVARRARPPAPGRSIPRRSAGRRGRESSGCTALQATVCNFRDARTWGRWPDGRRRARERDASGRLPDMGWHPTGATPKDPGWYPMGASPNDQSYWDGQHLDRPAALDRQRMGPRRASRSRLSVPPRGPADCRPIPTAPPAPAKTDRHRRSLNFGVLLLVVSGIALMLGSVGPWIHVTGSVGIVTIPRVHSTAPTLRFRS